MYASSVEKHSWEASKVITEHQEYIQAQKSRALQLASVYNNDCNPILFLELPENSISPTLF